VVIATKVVVANKTSDGDGVSGSGVVVGGRGVVVGCSGGGVCGATNTDVGCGGGGGGGVGGSDTTSLTSPQNTSESFVRFFRGIVVFVFAIQYVATSVTAAFRRTTAPLASPSMGGVSFIRFFYRALFVIFALQCAATPVTAAFPPPSIEWRTTALAISTTATLPNGPLLNEIAVCMC
jgi:hypothetical protein